jgi:hypothetical protein
MNHKIQKALGCDLPLEGLVRACNNVREDPEPLDFEVGIFTGHYVTGMTERRKQELRVPFSDLN